MFFNTKSVEETQKIAGKIAKRFLGEGRVFLLSGELGAGKTTFVQGFAKALGIKDSVISPTFILIRQHKIPKTKNSLFHIDLYRVKNANNLGIEEILENQGVVVLIEWAEKLNMKLPSNTVKINITKISEKEREIRVSDLRL